MTPPQNKKPFRLLFLIPLLAGLTSCRSSDTWRSELYPENDWNPGLANLETDKVIQDFSYAGYRRGEVPIPDVEGPIFDVTLEPFNADNTGSLDATDAIQAAIHAAGDAPGGGVVFLPAGTYRLSIPVETRGQALLLDRPNVVLRGAGADKTYLLNTTTVMRTPTSLGSKAVIRVAGPGEAGMRRVTLPVESPLTRDILHFTREIPVREPRLFKAGDTVLARITLTDAWIAETREPTWAGNAKSLNNGQLAFRRTVTAVDEHAGTVTLDVPIRHPLKLRDHARLSLMEREPLSGVGLEDFSIGNVQHPGTQWSSRDYMTEGTSAWQVHGTKLIEINNARDGWVRRLQSFQPPGNTSTAHMLSDGVRINSSTHITVEDCVFQRPQYGGGGGNGYMFTLFGSQECLIKNSVASFSRHGFSIADLGASGNVITGCIDRDGGYATADTGEQETTGLASDFHKNISMANLIDTCTGDASYWEAVYRPWGGPVLHGIASTHTVFWNTFGTDRTTSRVEKLNNFDYAVRSDQGGWGYVIGTRGPRSGADVSQNPKASNGQSGPIDHVEGLGRGDSLQPFSLYQDQLSRRLRQGLTTPVVHPPVNTGALPLPLPPPPPPPPEPEPEPEPELETWRSELYPETWTPPTGRSFTTDKLIQDFSYAGYRRGEEPIPEIAGPVFDVTRTPFGADPTGGSDSTAAIQAAIDAAAAVGGGVVFLPAGLYHISPPDGRPQPTLHIQDSNIVLRGAGKDKTFLLNTSVVRPTVILIAPRELTYGETVDITADLDSPTHRIPVADASAFGVGDKVRMVWSFTQGWIDEHDQGRWWQAPDRAPNVAQYHREVTAVNPAEGWIELDVPTRYTQRTRDAARVRTMRGNLSGVGLESFSIGNVQHPGSEFRGGDYKTEGTAAWDVHGSRLIAFRDCFDSWIIGVHSFQAEGNTSTSHMTSNGINLLRCFRMTLRDCAMRRPQYGGGGGNGYMYRIQSSQEILLENCIADFSRHGFVVSHAGASGNVFLNCLDRDTDRATGDKGLEGYVTGGAGSDHHMHFSHSNLFDSCMAVDSFYTAHHRGKVGGRVPHGLTSAHGVFWNTTGDGTREEGRGRGAVVRTSQGRYGYVIGTSGPRSSVSIIGGPGHSPRDHVEGEGLGTTLVPQSLYRDQLNRRLGR